MEDVELTGEVDEPDVDEEEVEDDDEVVMEEEDDEVGGLVVAVVEELFAEPATATYAPTIMMIITMTMMPTIALLARALFWPYLALGIVFLTKKSHWIFGYF